MRYTQYTQPYGIKTVKYMLKNPQASAWNRWEIEMDFGDGEKLAKYLSKTKKVDYDEETETWSVKGAYHWTDCYFYPNPL